MDLINVKTLLMDLINMKPLLVLLFTVGCCAGQKLLPQGPLEGVLGKNVTFQTLITPGTEFLSIQWTFNPGPGPINIASMAGGKVNVHDDYKGRLWVNSSTGGLILGPLDAKDSGDYSINMLDKDVQGSAGEITLRVLEPVSNLVIRANVTHAVEHSDVSLTCSAKGSYLKFSWTNGTKPIVADKRLTLSEGPNHSELKLADVLRSDLVGPIYCTAANKLETEKSAPFNLTVYYGPENMVMTTKPPAGIIKKGANLTMSCSAQSNPPALLMWYHNGLSLKKSNPELVLTDITKEQSGNYSCKSYNSMSMRNSSSDVAQFIVQEAISGTKIIGPAETLIAGNHTVNLSCQATAGMPTTRAWLKDNKPLSPSARMVISQDMSVVMIKMVQKEDNGEFKCQLSNDVSTNSAAYKMVVNFGPEPAKVVGEGAVEVTDPVVLKCSAVSIPAATYTWKFNGTMTDVTTADYSFDKAKYKNTGTYTCVAHNAITGLTATADHKLSVKEEGALEEGLSEGAVAGIVIGVLLALALAIAGVIYYRRKQTIESPY